jgi:Ca-activated chloride channel family protein
VVAELAAVVILVMAIGAEMLHAWRIRRIAPLVFGPTARPAHWARIVPALRVLSLTGLCWGLGTLLLLPPKIHAAEIIPDEEMNHLLIVLDVSPSMRLEDAGEKKDQSRMKRASILMSSFFERANMNRYLTSVVAVYNSAKPVVEDTKDLEVIRNIFNDLPMHHAFISGETDLFSGLKEAAEMAKPWNPRSTTLLLISDGDTVPGVGMPKMPVSVANTVVVGVGDSLKGSFINGHNSRQDVSTLRQLAIRLNGTYHNGNEKHLSTDLIDQLAVGGEENPFEKLTRREYALAICGLSALIYALIPWLLHYWGTGWKPGVLTSRKSRAQARRESERARNPKQLHPSAS